METNTSTTFGTATKEEYIAFLYLALAGADFKISDKELYKIGRRISGLLVQHFPETRFEFKSLLRKVKKEVEIRSPMERRQLIETLHKKFELPLEIQIDIVSDLHDLMNADDIADPSEYALINLVRVCFAENRA